MRQQNRNQLILGQLLLLLASSCSGLTSKSRTSSTETNESTSVANSQTGGGEFTPSSSDEASRPEVISGSYLVEVLVSTHCVGIQGEAIPSCKSVRLSAKIKVNDAELVRFASDTSSALGIKSSSWEITSLPENTTCHSTGGGFDFTPLCTSSSGSLGQAKIKATLNLVATDGSTFKGESPNSSPDTGAVYGNFMLLDASAGLTVPVPPAVTKYPGASADFTQIWAVLKGGEDYLDDLKHVTYVTNILYDGSGSTDWDGSDELCRNKLNSGKGVGKWRLPTIEELCGQGYSPSSSPCDGGLAKHGINSVTFSGGRWDPGTYFWSSTAGGNPGGYWGASILETKSALGFHTGVTGHVFCVR